MSDEYHERKKSGHYTLAEDMANSISHGIGAALSIAGLSLLVVFAAMKGDPWRIVSFSVYGATLVTLYLASTLYHSIQSPRVRPIMRRFDHIAIYLLIAGTYTPFTLVVLRGTMGWTLFGIVWGCAVAGIIMKLHSVERHEVISVILYIAMGWVGIIAFKPVLDSIPLAGVIGMVAGGVFYTAGVAFYVWNRLPYNHSIWHCFVLAGSACHFFVVLLAI
jgi:hemolysin III